MKRATFDARMAEIQRLEEGRQGRSMVRFERDRLVADVLAAIATGEAEEPAKFAEECRALYAGEVWYER